MTTGKTTSQMLNAPPNAIYIWHNAHVSYPKALAKHLGRDDLEIVGRGWLDGTGFYGRCPSGVVVDHYTRLSVEQSEALEYLRAHQTGAEETVKQGLFARLDSAMQEVAKNAVAGQPRPPSPAILNVASLIRLLDPLERLDPPANTEK